MRCALVNELAVSPAGDIYFVDTGENRIARLDATGRITTVAGRRDPAFGQPLDIAPLERFLSNPQGLAVLRDGTLVFHEGGRVAMLRPGENQLRTLLTTGFAGYGPCGTPSFALAGDDLYFYDPQACQIVLLSPSTANPVRRRWPEQVPTPRPAYRNLSRLNVDSAGNLYWAGLGTGDRDLRLYRLAPGASEMEVLFKFDSPFMFAQIFGDGRDRLFVLVFQEPIHRLDPMLGTLRVVPELTVDPDFGVPALFRAPASVHPAPDGAYIVYDAGGLRLLRVTGL